MAGALKLKHTILLTCISCLSLLFTLLSAYTCKYIKVTEPNRAPFFLGIWKVEGRVIDLEFDIGNSNQCISWTDTNMYIDGSLRAAKSFTVWSTMIGSILCGALLLMICVELVQRQKQRQHEQQEQPTTMRLSSRQEMIFVVCLECGSVFCLILTALFYNAFGATICTDEFINRDLTCRWGSGAYFTVGAVVGWTSTALCIGFMVLPQLERQRNFVSTATGGGEGRRDASRRTRDDAGFANRNNNNRGLERSLSRKRNNRQGDTNSASTTAATNVKPPPKRMSSLDRVKAIQSKLQEVRDTEQPEPVEASNSKKPSSGTSEDRGERTPTGTPLISVSEDSEGNRIRTTVLRFSDENGEEVVEKTTEVLPDDVSDL